MDYKSPAELAVAREALEAQRKDIISDTLLSVHDVLTRWNDGLLTGDEALGYAALLIVPATELHRIEPPVTDEEIARDRAEAADDGRGVLASTKLNRAHPDRGIYEIPRWLVKRLKRHGIKTYGWLAEHDVHSLLGLVDEDEMSGIELLHEHLGKQLYELDCADPSWGRPYVGE